MKKIFKKLREYKDEGCVNIEEAKKVGEKAKNFSCVSNYNANNCLKVRERSEATRSRAGAGRTEKVFLAVTKIPFSKKMIQWKVSC